MKRILVGFFIFFLATFAAQQAFAVSNIDHAPRIRARNGTSTNWSGYAVETNLTNPQSNAVSDVKGTWVVPMVNCVGVTTNTYSAAWVGIDGYSDNSVEQLGTEHNCINGQPVYSSWYEMYPKPSFNARLAIKPGDVISAEVKYVNGKFLLTMVNTTIGKSFSASQKSNAQRQSAEWVMEAPWSGGILPLANFGIISFTNAQATINNTVGSISAFANDPISMTNNGGGTKALVSGLGTGGNNFSITWVSSN